MLRPSEGAARRDLREWDDALSAALAAGVVFTDEHFELLHADPVARRLMHVDREDELVLRWGSMRPRLVEELAHREGFDAGDAVALNLDLELPGRSEARKLRIDLHVFREPGSDRRLLLLRDREVVAALGRDLDHAGRGRALLELRRSQIHDLRAPLNAMSLNLDLATERLGDPADAERDAEIRDGLSVIAREIDRLSRLVSGLLTAKDPDTGERIIFDLRALLREVAVLLGPAADERELKIRAETPETPLVVKGRRDRIKQAFLNLAVNGLQAMESGSGGTLSLVCRQEQDEAIVEVGDEGAGIPPERMERLFELHFTTKARGTGIGLFVARSTFTSHGGGLDIESVVGRGTRVFARLPLARNDEEKETTWTR